MVCTPLPPKELQHCLLEGAGGSPQPHLGHLCTGISDTLECPGRDAALPVLPLQGKQPGHDCRETEAVAG